MERLSFVYGRRPEDILLGTINPKVSLNVRSNIRDVLCQFDSLLCCRGRHLP